MKQLTLLLAIFALSFSLSGCDLLSIMLDELDDRPGTGNVRLEVSEANDNPDASIIPVEEDDESKDYGIFIFGIEADGGDITLEELPVTVDFANPNGGDVTYEYLVDDAYLEINGEEFSHKNLTDAQETATSSVTLTFDDMDLEIEENEEKTFTLFVSFTQQSGNYDDGAIVQGQITNSTFNDAEAEGADDLDGSAMGSTHTLLVEGVFLEPVSTDTQTSENQNGNTVQATYTVTYDLTAFEGDFYIPKGAVASSSASADLDDGVRYTIEDGDGNSVDVETSTAHTVSSTADTESGVWAIDEGETETFTLKVIVEDDDVASGFFRLQLEGARYADTAAEASTGTTSEVTATPEEEFQTGYMSID